MSMSQKRKVKELEARVTALEKASSTESTPTTEDTSAGGDTTETPSEETQNGGK